MRRRRTDKLSDVIVRRTGDNEWIAISRRPAVDASAREFDPFRDRLARRGAETLTRNNPCDVATGEGLVAAGAQPARHVYEQPVQLERSRPTEPFPNTGNSGAARGAPPNS